MPNTDKITYQQVISEEDILLRQRRQKLMGEAFANALNDTRFGIALSGGGIRSATINLGILKTLNKFGILKQSDYLSTVSGGGYTGAYIQATLREKGPENQLFDDQHIDYMRQRGEYLFPGAGGIKMWNQITLVVGFIVSFLMSLVSPATLVILVVGAYKFFRDTQFITTDFTDMVARWNDILWPEIGYLLGGIMVLHYVFNVGKVYKLDGSNWFNRLEAGIVIAATLSFLLPFFQSFTIGSFHWDESMVNYIGWGGLLVILGFVTNPNATSFHRFYRKQLADVFLHFAWANKNIPLHQLTQVASEHEGDYLAPYPLINTCLNLQSSKDPHFQGAKASDYFLLSPLFCGAKLVGYVPTATTSGYRNMTLPAAVTISAAAVNPGLGAYSSKLLSILLTFFNLRLGFWTWNPLHLRKTWQIVWWPFYFFYELLGKIGTDKKMVNISDGGHIENLGVMELLRRKCRLIIAVDAGADPAFTFSDLENLTVRARNELGIDIRFRPDQIPEEVMRVNPSHGYSRKRYAVADLYQLWEKEEIGEEECVVHFPGGKKVGVLVYVKSTVTAPTGRPDLDPHKDRLKYGTYKYKIYHPEFPHESTADQFFDPIQWESYFQLGQFIAADMLGVDDLNAYDVDHAFTIPYPELYRRFDENIQLFGAMKIPTSESRGRGIDEIILEDALSVDTAPVDKYEM
ncbi:MAG: hypothetical protein R2795_20535 [Saprospiraceae bacterium]